MGMGFSSGNIKYVFTQATAPAGEGEVKGSLWYDTTTNDLYTYNGAAWVDVTAGISAAPLTLIETKTLNGTASTVTFSSITSHRNLVLIWELRNTTDTNDNTVIGIQFNGDTAGNYRHRTIPSGSTPVQVTGASYISIAAIRHYTTGGNDANAVGMAMIGNGQGDAKVSWSSVSCFSSGYLGNYIGGMWEAAADITSITVFDVSSINFKGKVSLYYAPELD